MTMTDVIANDFEGQVGFYKVLNAGMAQCVLAGTCNLNANTAHAARNHARHPRMPHRCIWRSCGQEDLAIGDIRAPNVQIGDYGFADGR